VLKKQESHSGSGVDPPLMCGWEGQENDSIFFSFGSKNEKYVKWTSFVQVHGIYEMVFFKYEKWCKVQVKVHVNVVSNTPELSFNGSVVR